MCHRLYRGTYDSSNDLDRVENVLVSETRLQRLLRTGRATPRFLQGVYPFAGRGLFDITPLDPYALGYDVPQGTVAEVHYVRGGNHSDDLIYLALMKGVAAVRYFAIGPKSDFHVPLAIVETHAPGTRLEIGFAAARGLTGTVVVDVGIVEIAQPGEA